MPQLSSNLWIVEDKDSLEKHDIQLVRVDGGELVPHPRVGLAVVLRDPGWPALADVLEAQGCLINQIMLTLNLCANNYQTELKI